MKIVDVDVVPLTSSYVQPTTLRSYAVVRVTTEDGRAGVGEPYAGVNVPTVGREAIAQLKPLFVGKDAQAIGDVMAEAHAVVEYFDHHGLLFCLLGAVDWALHDLAAQRAGVPLHRLLNPRSRDSVELYASTGPTALTLDSLRAEIDRVIDAGYRTLKIRIGCGRETPDAAIERARVAARHVAGRARLGIDAGQQVFTKNRWTFDDAARVNAALGELGLLFYEDPFLITDLAAYQRLRAMRAAPIAGGEMFNRAAEFDRYCAAGAFDVAQPDACVLAGPAETTAAIAAAERHGLHVFLHGWAGPVAQMQNVHAALASATCDVVEFCPLHHPLLVDGMQPVWQFRDGRLAAPDAPGMGTAPIAALADKYPFRNVSSLIA